MKPLVIYHKNCADGFGAAFAAWLKFGDEAEYLPMQHGDYAFTEDGWIGREVYILDFSLPKDRMEALLADAKRVVWLDHHKSAFEMWCGGIPEDGLYIGVHEFETKPAIILDNNRSGALIAWEYFHPDKEVPLLIKHIDDYDRWQFKLEGTKEFNKALWSYAPWSFEQWNGKFDFPSKNIPYVVFISQGAAILSAHEQNVQAVVKGAGRKCRILKASSRESGEHWEANIDIDQTGLSANCPPHLASDVGHQLANQSGTYGLLWHINKEGKCLCSLRSNGDFDVSAIAKSFGGGGHKNAAGFEVDIQTLLGWISGN